MSATNTLCGMIGDAKFRRLSRQYERENPHNLPELQRRQRVRFTRRVGVPEKVYSTIRPVA